MHLPSWRRALYPARCGLLACAVASCYVVWSDPADAQPGSRPRSPAPVPEPSAYAHLIATAAIG
ncbi:MAG: hypothetical protein MUF54_04950, partial [Polyangiaceae bacterium]|nr:hypothetical protein [Polyangiaceae bacterium]